MDVRKKIGLTQPQLADYLGVTRSQLAMYEKGLRSLPIPALIKLGTLETVVEKHMEHKQKTTPEYVKTQAAHAVKKLQKHMVFHQAKALTTELKLEAKQQQYTQHSLLLEVLDNMKDTHTDPKDKLWHNITKRMTEKNLEKNSLHTRHMLELQLEGHRHQHKLAKEKHEALKTLK